MNKLEEARLEINEIDKEMIALFKRRMKASRMVAEYKKENNMAIYDSKREEEVRLYNIKLLDDIELTSYYSELLDTILKVSKDYQGKILGEE